MYKYGIIISRRLCFQEAADFSAVACKEVVMSKKAKIILAVTVSASFVAFGAAAATVVICKKIYEKNYFSAD